MHVSNLYLADNEFYQAMKLNFENGEWHRQLHLTGFAALPSSTKLPRNARGNIIRGKIDII